MAGLNQCNFIGNIGKIESRYLSNGDSVTNCSIAVNEYYKDKDGNKQEKCEWVNITAYKKLAEIMSEYCTKGMQIFVSGKMQTRKWTDKNGVERYTTEIIATDMKMLGSKNSGSDSQDTSGHASNRSASSGGASGFDDMEDEIPF